MCQLNMLLSLGLKWTGKDNQDKKVMWCQKSRVKVTSKVTVGEGRGSILSMKFSEGMDAQQ